METTAFTKMVAAGNDFVVIQACPQSTVNSPQKLARKMCDRKYGVGADGMLLISPSSKADARMRIFNADGSEAEMCGNGARCAALYIGRRSKVEGRRSRFEVRSSKFEERRARVFLETNAGTIESLVAGDDVKIKLTPPANIKLDLPVRINNRNIRVNFINTGVPHAVIFVDGIDSIEVSLWGRRIRYHRVFLPQGANVDFVEVEAKSVIRTRTYERGVEDETLACGTGSAASALIFALKSGVSSPVRVRTRGGEVLKIHFTRAGCSFKDVWLEGKAGAVFEGTYPSTRGAGFSP